MELNKIYNEDCQKTMERMEEHSVDIILTSPPYNISRVLSNREYGLKVTNLKYKDYKDNLTNEEYINWTLKNFELFNKILKKDGVILYNLSYGTEFKEKSELMWLLNAEIIKQGLFTIGDCMIWKKKNAQPLMMSKNHLTRICEFIMVFVRNDDYFTFKRNHKVIKTSHTGQNYYNIYYNFVEADNNDGVCSIHKATYSTELCRKLLNIYGEKGFVVYDPFMGTGTTAVACHKEKMSYIGSEISKEYCDYANKRIETETMQLTLF